MSRCRGCNKEIEVKWVQPEGCKKPILECLCYTCLWWVDVAKSKEPLQPPNARRKPREPAVEFADGTFTIT